MEGLLQVHADAKSVSTKRLVGKVTIITGGARRIGAATAKLFAQNGANVVKADIIDDLGESLANYIGGRYIHCNVKNETEVESAVNLALTWKGKLDIMFNNAGVPGQDGSIINMDMNQVNQLISVNVNDILHGIKHATRAMIKSRNGGSIICTTSSAALMGGLGSHSYTMSKEAVIGVMRTTTCELGVYGIRVNCISPHGVPSEMLIGAYRMILRRENVSAEDVNKIVRESESLLRGRSASAEDVAYAALFLASEEAGYITAHNLVIDGGFTSASGSLAFIYQ